MKGHDYFPNGPGEQPEWRHIESRVNGGAWVFLALDTAGPYLDERALLVPGQAEVREYRARFWDDGEVNGNWCDVAKVTVGP